MEELASFAKRMTWVEERRAATEVSPFTAAQGARLRRTMLRLAALARSLEDKVTATPRPPR